MQDAMREEKPAPVEQATDEEKTVIQKGDNHEHNERTGHGAC